MKKRSRPFGPAEKRGRFFCANFPRCLAPLWLLAAVCWLLAASPARVQLIYGDALQFTVGGPSQSVTVPNFGSIMPTNEITVEFWALSTAFTTQSAFMLNPDQGTNRFNAHINYNSPSPGVTYWDFGNISGGGRLGPVPAPANSVGSWVHYAFVASQSGNYMRIYTNGVLQSSQAGLNIFARGNYSLQIAGPGFPYSGILDEFRVWSVARTPAQIQADIYSTLSGSESNLVVYYKFDNTSGTVATNSATATGAAFNGTLNNGPTWVASTIPLAVYVVTNTADSGPGTLRTIVANATTGAIITFAPALSGRTIVLTNGAIALNKNVTVDAAALPNGIQINPNYVSRAFIISGATVALNSLTFTNGNAANDLGGAILNSSGIVTVNNCVFTNNASYYGHGGAIANQGTMTVNNCSFIGNYASLSVQFHPAGGGAIYNSQGHLAVNNCSFIGNHADSAAGGGAIDGTGSFPMTVNNCTFVDNHADGGTGGGAILNESGAAVVVNNSTFFINTAMNGVAGGGAVCDQSGAAVAVNNSTFVGNNATNSNAGGGIYASSDLKLTNCIVYANIAGNGAEIYSGNNLSMVTSLFGPETFPSAAYSGTAAVNSGNLFGSNPLLAPLGNYGGPTLTMLPMPGSPAINAGSDSVTGFLATDQRGLARKSSAHVDIGAVEVESSDINAANTVVTTTADSGFGSLRVAASLAGGGASNRVTFASGLSGQTILLANGELLLSNVTIDASALANGVQIDGNHRSRIFQIASGVTTALNSLTIKNGYVNATIGNGNGGGILNYGALTISNCIVTHNLTEYDDGGGIASPSGTLTVINSSISHNQSYAGGGIDCGGSLMINGSTITNNKAEDDSGGGIYASGTFTATNSTISYNGADRAGGGLILNGNTAVMNNCAIVGNLSDGYGHEGITGGGGGIEVLNNGVATINNCTISGNVAPGGGGVLTSFGGNLTLNSCTIAGNQGGDYGGGILNGGDQFTVSTVNLTNCIFYSNTASLGLELCNLYGTMNFSYCLLGPEGLAAVYNADTATSTNSFVLVNPVLAPLGNYGGPTQTMPPEPGSPAIGAGKVSAASQLSTDQRGFARVVGGKVDIGAVELQSGQAYPVVLNTLDTGPGSLRQVISNSPAGATVTFDPSLAGQTITLTSGQIVLSNTVIIDGSQLGSGIQINGHGTSRIFQVNPGTLAVMAALTLTNGNPGSGNFGGAILTSGGSQTELVSCTLARNSSSQGGAIENEGVCALWNCTLTGNHASGNGGAIDNNQGPLQLLQCTVVSNSASGGGGVANFLAALGVTNCILAANTAVSGGGDIYNFGSSTNNNGGSNIVQLVFNGGVQNGNATLLFKAPLLAPLGNFGGLTPSMPPLPGSPAIDGGNTAANHFTTDQRGLPRVSGQRVDIGAVEVQIASAPYPITGLPQIVAGALQFSFTNMALASFTVLTSPNLAAPVNTWSNLGPAIETPPGSGQFQFTDPHSATNRQSFYRVTSP